MRAPVVGGAFVFVASKPYEPGFGSGSGIGVRAEAVSLPRSKSNTAIIKNNPTRAVFNILRVCSISVTFIVASKATF